ncbi:hypothetical protein BHE74_00028368 [Ensete ventricosum]|nr:hypothetical protein BHE74_00028368 [Ensete ventricosum]
MENLEVCFPSALGSEWGRHNTTAGVLWNLSSDKEDEEGRSAIEGEREKAPQIRSHQLTRLISCCRASTEVRHGDFLPTNMVWALHPSRSSPLHLNFGSREGVEELDTYLSKKHDQLLAKLFQPNTYKKKSSLAIVDGFSVEITKEQGNPYNLSSLFSSTLWGVCGDGHQVERTPAFGSSRCEARREFGITIRGKSTYVRIEKKICDCSANYLQSVAVSEVIDISALRPVIVSFSLACLCPSAVGDRESYWEP